MPWRKILKLNKLLPNRFFQIFDGPDRQILSDHTNMTIYNGFKANDIVFDNLPADNTIDCGFELQLSADPIPTRKLRRTSCP